jgi:hypothetical protein
VAAREGVSRWRLQCRWPLKPRPRAFVQLPQQGWAWQGRTLAETQGQTMAGVGVGMGLMGRAHGVFGWG